MTLQQGLAFSIVGCAVVVFASGRFRYDIVALGALLAGLVTGVVPAKQAFTGFTSDVVVIIASALVVSAAVARSGVIEQLALRPLLNRLKTVPSPRCRLWPGTDGSLSMPTKNVGALAILMPVALRLARKTKTSPSSLLMPMSFMSLLGGLVTLVGTSTNIIVSQVRAGDHRQAVPDVRLRPRGSDPDRHRSDLRQFRLAAPAYANRQGQAGAERGRRQRALRHRGHGAQGTWPEGLKTVADLKLGESGVKLAALLSWGRADAGSPAGLHP